MSQQNWLKTRKITDIFEPTRAREYQDQFGRLWEALVGAHSSMYVVERVRRFDPDLLLAPEPQHFWNLVLRDFSHEAALAAVNALTEKMCKTLTFHSLAKWMERNCRPRVQEDLRKALKLLAPDEGTSELLRRAQRVRHNLLAHLNKRAALDPQERRKLQISFEELQSVVHESQCMLHKLWIGEGERAMLPLEYMSGVQQPIDQDSRPDIDRLLDKEAERSPFLKLPENSPCLWKEAAAKLSEEQRERFNYWRQRIGLPACKFED